MEIENDKDISEPQKVLKTTQHSARGRKPACASRAAEFRRELIIWRETPESIRPSLRTLAHRLGAGTTHQILSYHLNRLNRWQAEENAKPVRARTQAEGREMTLRECCDAIITPGLFRQIEELRKAAERGPLNRYQVKILKLYVRQGWAGASEILAKCRQMTPEEERRARAAEKATMFATAAVNHIARIKQAGEKGPLPWRDIEILKILARQKCAGAKELLQKYSKSSLPRPQVPQ